jgi:hypothetical protein
MKLLPAPTRMHLLRLRLARLFTTQHVLAAAAATYLVLTLCFTASFFWPRSVNFSFARPSCFTSPTLLPNLISKHSGKTFTATPRAAISLAGYPLYSHTTCIEPTQAPQKSDTEKLTFSPLGIGFLQKQIRVSVEAAPAIQAQAVLNQPLSTKKPLVLPLATADVVFDYRLLVNGQTVACSKLKASLVCDISKIGLRQSASYHITLQRLFKNKLIKDLLSQTVTTVGAVRLSKSSIPSNRIIYDVPQQINLTFNKTIKTYGQIQLEQLEGKKRHIVPTTLKVDGRAVTLGLIKPLARSARFEVTVQNLIATDGGHLPEPLSLPFRTSGGPQVKGVSIGSYKVAATANVTLTFDSKVNSKQNVGKFIKLEIGGNSVPANVSVNGKGVTLNPTSPLPTCTAFTVRVVDGLENQAGISGNSAWSYRSRTLCQSVFSIGSSVKGRAITAYRFGSGKSLVVFVGGTHGNEQSSVHSLNSWIDYLERNPGAVPAHRSVIVIPNLNPDGYAASKRTNWNNVDLNRNFPANNWKRGVTMPGGSYNPNGGGKAPLSEPESKALANYVLKVRPRLVLTYHAAAGVVMPNDSGDSVKLAKVYDQKSNLGYEPSSQTDDIFDYDTTGSFEEWLYDKPGIPALLVELWTTSSNEFYKNQNAMAYMAQLP